MWAVTQASVYAEVDHSVVMMQSPCAGADLDPPLWIVPYKAHARARALSLSSLMDNPKKNRSNPEFMEWTKLNAPLRVVACPACSAVRVDHRPLRHRHHRVWAGATLPGVLVLPPRSMRPMRVVMLLSRGDAEPVRG